MDLICVYCTGVFTSDTPICSTCNEYDGLMGLSDGIKYLDLDPADFE